MHAPVRPQRSYDEIAARAAAIKVELQRRRLTEHEDIPPIFKPFLQPSRYKGAHGGRGGAKSHVFATLLLARCMARKTRAVCVREIQVSLEQSVKRLLEDKIKHYRLEDDFQIFNTHIKCPHDGIIIFQGMQNHTSDSIKSLEGYDIAWVEEAQSLSDRSLTLLRPTIRAQDSEIWFSWNPRNATDPVDVMLRSDNPPPGSIVIYATYQDNPYFPDVLRVEMEWDRSRDPDKYAHVWLGAYERRSESRVFKNWKTEEFETPDDAVLLFGGDWGFSVDPTVLVASFVVGRTMYIPYETFQIGTEIDNIPTLFDGVACGCVPEKNGVVLRPCHHPERHAIARDWTITADSARPETISYLQKHGYPKVVPAVKGANSVKEGVIFLQNFDIVVHPRCIHTIDELTMYSFKSDPLTGLVTPILEDKKNHVIDSLRYSVEKLRADPDFDYREAGMTSAATW